MKRWILCGILILCSSVLFACGNQEEKKDTYTKDAQVEESIQDQSIKDEEVTRDSQSEAQVKEEQKVTEVKEESKKTPIIPNPNNSTSNTPPPTIPEKPVENEQIAKVTMSIDTKTLLNNMDKVAKNKQAYVPADGWILAPITIEIQDGDTVFDVLSKVTRDRRIHMEYQGANQNIYNSVYIQGIGQLYEFDCGELSGWMYTINGAYVSKGASGVKVEDGMNIEWRYTCDLGRDLGL